ncbi:hypothetical protein [Haloparvum sedimenti]|uniref:hypothetical protein n=1 Tax=Haloparvum sedimenti TaxID=1678448 RepID=UPI00071E7E4D|nr:hypothetical protein [Haloparvum sedimenti]
MSLGDRISAHLRENRTGMVHDLLFAVAWVAFVTVLTSTVFTTAPQWAYYLFMLAGIPAYFGFFISLEIAKEQQAARD